MSIVLNSFMQKENNRILSVSGELTIFLSGAKSERQRQWRKPTSRIAFSDSRVQFSVTKAKVQKVDGHINEIVAINNRNGNRDRGNDSGRESKSKREAKDKTAKG